MGASLERRVEAQFHRLTAHKEAMRELEVWRAELVREMQARPSFERFEVLARRIEAIDLSLDALLWAVRR